MRDVMRWMAGALALAGAQTIGGCDDGGDPSGPSGPRAIEVRFAAVVGSEPFACTKTFAGLGASGATLTPTDLRFYVHDVRAVTAGGAELPLTLEQDGKWQLDDLALLDFEDKTGSCKDGTVDTNAVIRGTIADGDADVVGLRFKVGVPFALNHSDSAAAPAPLSLSGLFWNWQGGRKFVRIDGTVEGAGGWSLHLGSTGCTLAEGTTEVAACDHPNRPEIALADFDVDQDTVTLDLAALVAGVDLKVDGGGMPGCMSGADDPECAAIFEHLGLDLTTGSPKAGQTAFR